MQNTKRLFEYFQPSHYNLELSLERDKRTFSGIVIVNGHKVSAEPIQLHAKELTVTSVVLGTASVPFSQDGDELVVDANLPAGTYTLSILFNGHITDPMHGLYPCYFEVNGEKKELLATQFESHHAREVFPCVDEPEAKASFDLTLITEQGVTVLGNMPVQRTQNVDFRTKTVFGRSPTMSPYLLAFVVGELQKETVSTESGVEINVYATRAHELKNLSYATMWAKRSIEYFEEYFGVPYPLPKCDHVALPDFSVSAMENWGLVTYREAALLTDSDTATTETKQHISMVMSHEISHQWFGNLVTMKWWDDLWLNESFANLMGYAACDALEPAWHSWDEFSATECFSALKRDALDGVQPVKVAVESPDEIGALFDHAIVYAKGSRLLKMLHDYVGETAFRGGLKAYFEKHAYGNTTGDNLWKALEDASGIDVGTFMQNWLTLPGYPLVTVQNEAISQQRFFIGEHSEDTTLWQIPLLPNDNAFPRLLTTKTVQAPSTAALLNMSDGAHFITLYDDDQMKTIQNLIAQNQLPTNDILRLINEWSLLSFSGQTDCEPLIRLLASLSEQRDPNIWQTAENALYWIRILAEDAPDNGPVLQVLMSPLLSNQLRRLGWEPRVEEPEADTRTRPYILDLVGSSRNDDAVKTAQELYEKAGFVGLPVSTRKAIGRIVVSAGVDDTKFEALFALYRSATLPDLRTDLTDVLSATRSQTQQQHILTSLTDGTIRPQDTRRWVTQLLSNPTSRDSIWRWIRDEWNWVEQMFKNDITYDIFPTLTGRYLTSKAHLDEYRTFFEPLRSEPGLTRAIDLGEKELGATVDYCAKNQPLLFNILEAIKEIHE